MISKKQLKKQLKKFVGVTTYNNKDEIIGEVNNLLCQYNGTRRCGKLDLGDFRGVIKLIFILYIYSTNVLLLQKIRQG